MRVIKKTILTTLLLLAVSNYVTGQSSDRIRIPFLSECCASTCQVKFVATGKDSIYLSNPREICIAAEVIKQRHIKSLTIHRDSTGTTAYIIIPRRIKRRLLSAMAKTFKAKGIPDEPY